MNWTYTDCNSSRETPRYICIFFVVVVKFKKKQNFFSLFSFFFNFFSYFLLYFPTTPQLLLNFHIHIFLWFFSIGEKFFFSFFLFCFSFPSFFSFFLFSFLSFLFLVFLSHFLLKSSNTPLLFLNFHFHRNITLPKKKKKREREREALFSNWTSYIFLNFGFLFLFLNILFLRV